MFYHQGFSSHNSEQHLITPPGVSRCQWFNSLRPRPNRRHFADDIFKCIFENENEWISPKISLKFVPKVRINNIPALVQIMAWRRPGDKPLSEPMMVSLLTHICVTRPQWFKTLNMQYCFEETHIIYVHLLFCFYCLDVFDDKTSMNWYRMQGSSYPIASWPRASRFWQNKLIK